jgi:hypothetical protein
LVSKKFAFEFSLVQFDWIIHLWLVNDYDYCEINFIGSLIIILDISWVYQGLHKILTCPSAAILTNSVPLKLTPLRIKSRSWAVIQPFMGSLILECHKKVILIVSQATKY